MIELAVQLCLAYRNEGGRVIVVLSLVPKTEMEETFRFIIPEHERYGSTFVFRQVSSEQVALPLGGCEQV